MPRSTAPRNRAIISSLVPLTSPWPALMRMHPSPTAETLSPLVPSVLFCMVSSSPARLDSLRSLSASLQILLVGYMFHPIHDFSVKLFLYGNVSHGRGRRSAVPMLFTGTEGGDGLFHHRFHLGVIGYIATDRQCLVSLVGDFLGRGLHLLFVPVSQHHARTGFSKSLRCSKPQSGRSSCNECDFVLKRDVHLLFFSH